MAGILLFLASACASTSDGSPPDESRLTSSQTTYDLAVGGSLESSVPGRISAPTTAALDVSPSFSAEGAQVLHGPASSIIDYLLFDGRTLASIYYEVELYTQTCMAEAGWDYQIPPAPAESIPTLGDSLQFRESHGYGIASGETLGSAFDSVDGQARELSEAERAAFALQLEGTASEHSAGDARSNRGCYGEAEDAVLAQIPYFQPDYADIPFEFLEALLADERYQAAIRSWSQCMEARGFTFASPDDVRQSLYDEWLAGPVDGGFLDRERLLAVADGLCFVTEVAQIKTVVELDILESLIDHGRVPSTWRDAASS